MRQSLFGGDVSGLSCEATVVRLGRLAAARGGTVAASDMEDDDLLVRDRRTTSAAARLPANGTDVVSRPATDARHWFPHARLTFTRMSGDAAGRG